MSLRRLLLLILGCALAVALVPSWLTAQEQTMTTGGITGVVVDPNNAVVVHARVTLTNVARKTTEETTTNNSGAYQFVLLEPGAYTLTVEASGFQTATRQVNVAVGEPLLVNVQLAIQVKGVAAPKPAKTALIQAENGSLTTTLTRQQVTELPNPGNDLTYLAQIVPGVIMNTESGSGHFVSSGTPATSNGLRIDGMDVNEPLLNVNQAGANGLLLGMNEIQEVTVATDNYGGNSGDFAGADVSYVTRSGEGGLHGNVDYLWNGRKLNANSWLNNQAGTVRPFDNVNQWTGAVGGPLKKNRLFFYFENDGLRVVVPTVQQVIIPSLDFESATATNLSGTLPNSEVFYCANMTINSPDLPPVTCPSSGGVTTTPPNVHLGEGIFNVYNQAAGAANAADILPPNQFADPNNANNTIFTGDGCGTFSENNSFGISEPNGTPPPTLLPCAEAFQSNTSNLSKDLNFSGRVDYILGVNDRAFVRYQRDSGIEGVHTDPFNNPAASPVFNAAANLSEDQGQLEETHAFGNTGTNQFLLAGQWYSNLLQPTTSLDPTTTFPAQLEFADGSFTPIGGILSTLPQGRKSTQVQLSDDFSKTWVHATIKVGGSFRRIDLSNHDFGRNTIPLVQELTLNDFYAGGTSNTGTVGDLLSQSFPTSTNLPMAYYTSSAYFEDDWQMTNSLNFTFAVRASHDSNPICRYLCFSRLTGDFNALANGANGQTLGDCPYNNSACLTTGGSEGILDNQEHAFPGYQSILWDPRASFAWRPYGASSHTVIRAGAGLFHDLFPAIVMDSLAANPPQLNAFTVVSNNLSPTETTNLFALAAEANTAFVSGFAAGQTVSQITTAPTVLSFTQPGMTATSPNMKAPEYQKWSLEIQQEMGSNTIFSVGIAGTHGVHLPIVNSSANAFGFSNLPAGTDPPSTGPLGPETYPTTLTTTFTSGRCAAPTSTPCTGIDPRFAQVTVISNSGNSNYNAATATFQHRFIKFGNGVVLASYTFSKAHDDVSNGGFLPFNGGETASLLSPQDPYNFRGAYGPSDYDARHDVSASYVWGLPLQQLFKGKGGSRLVNGWQIAGTVFYRSGFPFSVTDQTFSSSLAGNDYFSMILPEPTIPIPIKACTKSAAGTKGTPCLPIASFPGSGKESFVGGFSTGLRNIFRGPNYFNADFGLTKDTQLPGWHSAHLVLGLEVFNVLNHANFDLPIADISNPQFGTIQRQVSSPTSILGGFPNANASARMAQIKGEIRF
jgi:hypothetical protein